MTLFMVVRGDDNGQNFIVQEGLDEAAAMTLYQELLRGHKQWYAVWPYSSPDDRTGLIERHSLRL